MRLDGPKGGLGSSIGTTAIGRDGTLSQLGWPSTTDLDVEQGLAGDVATISSMRIVFIIDSTTTKSTGVSITKGFSWHNRCLSETAVLQLGGAVSSEERVVNTLIQAWTIVRLRL